MFTYKGHVTRVIDGGTADVSVDLGFKMYTKQRLRFARINTPEVRGEERMQGLKVKEFVTKKIFNRPIEIKTAKTGKYGCYIAEIYYYDNTGTLINLNDELVSKGLAVEVDY